MNLPAEQSPSIRDPAKPECHVLGIAVLVILAALGSAEASGQPSSPGVRPWTPPAVDSVVAWAAEARARFQTNGGDSATGPNQHAYDLVGKIGRRLIRSVGRENLIQVPAIKAVLDSLKLETDVVVDPASPYFVLIMARNPHKLKAEAVGYFYWYRGEDLRHQGVVFLDGHEPRMRVWWTSRTEAPYEWGIVSRGREPRSAWRLVLLRLNTDGFFWNLAQYEGRGPELGQGQASWADINGDEQPEIVAWVHAPVDSGFELCTGCPELLSERIFTEHENGFGLHDSRVLPSPLSTFVLFVRLLRDRNRAAAGRLLQDPSKLDEAIALGFGSRSRSDRWKLEYVEPGQAWPRWLALRLRSAPGEPLYIVHFTMREGRWIIQDWIRSRPPATTSGARGARGK